MGDTSPVVDGVGTHLARLEKQTRQARNCRGGGLRALLAFGFEVARASCNYWKRLLAPRHVETAWGALVHSTRFIFL